MPKKRNAFQYTKPTTPTHPSLSSDRAPKASSQASKSSVNHKLQQLRIEQQRSSPASLQSPQAPLNHPLSPSVQHILQIPQAPQPRPRPGLIVRGGRRGPAGPPPPGSWLANQREIIRDRRYKATETIGSTIELRPLPGLELPKKDTLQHQCFKRVAETWEDQYIYNQYYLGALPVWMKEVLLHYIARYSSYRLTANALEILFYGEHEIEGGTGTDGLAKVDLSGSIGFPLAFDDLKAFFAETVGPSLTKMDKNEDCVPEDWDAPPSPAQFLYAPRLNNLTHLSLARPHSSITWPQLLGMAGHLASLTHLSLAYWPRPTLHPHSTTSYYSSPTGRVQSASSTFYSNLDSDFREPADVMRQLSKNLLGLEWLDLTGCYPWVQCLGERQIDWFGAWSGLKTVIIDQGNYPDIKNDIPEIKEAWKSHSEKNRNINNAFTALKTSICYSEEWLRNEQSLVDLDHRLQDIIRGRDPDPPTVRIETLNAHLSWHDEGYISKSPTRCNPRAIKLEVIYASKDPVIVESMAHARRFIPEARRQAEEAERQMVERQQG